MPTDPAIEAAARACADLFLAGLSANPEDWPSDAAQFNAMLALCRAVGRDPFPNMQGMAQPAGMTKEQMEERLP